MLTKHLWALLSSFVFRFHSVCWVPLRIPQPLCHHNSSFQGPLGSLVKNCCQLLNLPCHRHCVLMPVTTEINGKIWPGSHLRSPFWDALLQLVRQLCQLAEKSLWLEFSRNLEEESVGMKWLKLSNREERQRRVFQWTKPFQVEASSAGYEI